MSVVYLDAVGIQKFSTTGAPTIDTTDSVEIGDIAVDLSAKKVYVCTDNTDTSAVWVDISVDNFSGSYNDLTDVPSEFTPEAHTHDDRYYTESEIDSTLGGYSTTSHTHTTIANNLSVTGSVTVAEGSGIAWGASNSMYVGGSDLRIYANDDLLLLPTNYVGIGTTTPSQKLDVSGWGKFEHPSGDALVYIKAGNNTGNSILDFGDSDANARGRVQYGHTADAMYLMTAGGTAMTIDSSHNIGIDATPAVNGLQMQKNHVYMYASANDETEIAIANGYGQKQGLTFLNNGSAGYTSFGLITDGTTLKLKTGAYNVGQGTDLATGWTEKITIDYNGYVGLSTTGPDRKLDVLDASNPQLRLTHTDGSVYTDLQTNSYGHLVTTPSGKMGELSTPKSQYSYSGGTMYIDTGITMATTSSGGNDPMILEVYMTLCPNASGSPYYKNSIVGYITIAYGWTSYFASTISWTSVVNHTAPGVASLTPTAVWYDGSTEKTTLLAGTDTWTNYNIFIKVTGLSSNPSTNMSCRIASKCFCSN